MKKIFSKIGLTALFVITITNAFPQELVRVQCENGYWGYQDKSSEKMIIRCKYFLAKDFFEGLAAVKISNNEGWGYIDKTGTEVIPFIFQRAGNFLEGLAAVRLDGKWGVIDKTGTEVVLCIYKRSELSAALEELDRERKAAHELERLNQKINSIVTSNVYDIILLRDEKEIKAKVYDANLSEIKYKMFDYLDGVTITVPTSDLLAIFYANGTRVVFDKVTETNSSSSKKQSSTNCVNSTAFGLDIGIGGTEIKEVFSTALGIRVAAPF